MIDREWIDAGPWLTGAAAGAVGAAVAAAVLFVTGSVDPAAVSVEAAGILVMPGAAFGLLYAAVAAVDRVGALAAEPFSGLAVGTVYGLLFWLTTLVGNEFSVGGLLAGLAFGSVIGLLYGASPYVDREAGAAA